MSWAEEEATKLRERWSSIVASWSTSQLVVYLSKSACPRLGVIEGWKDLLVAAELDRRVPRPL